MTINEAYLVAKRTTVTSTYVPSMNPGLYATFPEPFPGYIGPFPGLLLTEILIFNPRLVQEIISYAQETSQEAQETFYRVQEPPLPPLKEQGTKNSLK